MSTTMWILLAAGIIVLLMLQTVLKPFMLLTSLIVKSGVGIALLIVLNYLGAMISLSIPFNPASVLIAGFLGIPGLMLLSYLSYLSR